MSKDVDSGGDNDNEAVSVDQMTFHFMVLFLLYIWKHWLCWINDA